MIKTFQNENMGRSFVHSCIMFSKWFYSCGWIFIKVRHIIVCKYTVFVANFKYKYVTLFHFNLFRFSH